MNETLKTINDRIFSNPVYFIFGLSWFLVHWRFFVVMFFVGNENIMSQYGLTKDVYLKHILFDPIHPWIGFLIITLPFLLTWLILYWLQPKLLLTLFKKHTSYEVEKERVEIIAERELTKERTNKVKAEEAEVRAEAKKIEAKAETKANIVKIDPTVQWESDFLKFRSSPIYHSFPNFIRSFYSGDSSVGDPRLASYLDSMGIVNLSSNNPSYVNSFTEKGKYFIRRTQESQ